MARKQKAINLTSRDQPNHGHPLLCLREVQWYSIVLVKISFLVISSQEVYHMKEYRSPIHNNTIIRRQCGSLETSSRLQNLLQCLHCSNRKQTRCLNRHMRMLDYLKALRYNSMDCSKEYWAVNNSKVIKTRVLNWIRQKSAPSVFHKIYKLLAVFTILAL